MFLVLTFHSFLYINPLSDALLTDKLFFHTVLISFAG